MSQMFEVQPQSIHLTKSHQVHPIPIQALPVVAKVPLRKDVLYRGHVYLLRHQMLAAAKLKAVGYLLMSDSFQCFIGLADLYKKSQGSLAFFSKTQIWWYHQLLTDIPLFHMYHGQKDGLWILVVCFGNPNAMDNPWVDDPFAHLPRECRAFQVASTRCCKRPVAITVINGTKHWASLGIGTWAMPETFANQMSPVIHFKWWVQNGILEWLCFQHSIWKFVVSNICQPTRVAADVDSRAWRSASTYQSN